MKLLLSFFIILACTYQATSQNLRATYQVKQDIVVTFDKIGEKTIASLESTGKFYRKGSRYIYFEQPQYLDQYPDGKIMTQLEKDWYSNYSLNTDTIQRLNYKDTDSLIRRTRIDISGKSKGGLRNYFQNYDTAFYEWNILRDTKTVNGLKCQKADLSVKGFPQWEVWFTTDVPMEAGISNIIGLPGLVVEAYNIPLKTAYLLTSYTANEAVPDAVFWPAEFNEPFTQWKDLKKSSETLEKSRVQKQAELTNQ